MKSFIRSVLAIVAGVIVAGLFIVGIETIGQRLYPLPPGLDLKNPEALREMVRAMPLAAIGSVLLAWVVGALAGAWVAARIAMQWRIGHAGVIGAVVLAGAVANMLMIPHPAWMWAGALVLIPLAAYVGGRWAARVRSAS
jgi:hypothetical protein